MEDTLIKQCFFCCKIISVEIDKFNGNIDSFNGNGCKITNIFRIVNYLNVPKYLTSQKKGYLQSISYCEECQQIERQLGDLCEDLEVIKMKINYYLEELTKKIVNCSKESNNGGNFKKKRSRLQKIIHERCVLKANKVKVNPQIRLMKEHPKTEIKNEPVNEKEKNFDITDLNIDIGPVIPTAHAIIKEESFEIFINEEPEHIQQVDQSQAREIFLCAICSKTFNSRDIFYAHSRNVHKVQPIAEKSDINVKSTGKESQLVNDRQFKCTNCNKRYHHKKSLYRHRKMDKCNIYKGQNTSEGIWKCEHCGKGFKLEMFLNRHLREVVACGGNGRKGKPTKCPVCGIQLKYGYYLKNHLKRCKSLNESLVQVDLDLDDEEFMEEDPLKI